MAERELPIQPAKPAYVSMPAAVAAAIAHGNSLTDIFLPRWAETYQTSEERIRQAWEAELSRRSQEPDNSFDCEGK
jgi:hypothetical protein